MLVLPRFVQNRAKNVLFFFNFQKMPKNEQMAKWPNHFISDKQFQKRPNLADFIFLKAKWQP